MDCSIPGITVANMPIRAGGWRYSGNTTTIIVCFNRDACAGNLGIAAPAPANTTANATAGRRQLATISADLATQTFGDVLCAPGHTGFLCGQCADNWHGYKDAKLCSECTGSLFSAFWPLIALVVILILAALLKWKMGTVGISLETTKRLT